MKTILRLVPSWALTLVAAAVLFAGLFAYGNYVASVYGQISAAVAVFGALHAITDLAGRAGLIPRRNLLVLGVSDIMTYPRLASVSDPCGCSLTRTKFQSLTPDVIEAMDMTAYTEDIWSRMIESRAVGVVPNTLMELLMSRIAPISKNAIAQRTVGRTTQFAPFKYRHRTRNYNMSYFNVASGEETDGAGTGDIPASAWDIIVNVGPGTFASQLKYLGRYFIPGQHLIVEHKNTSSEVAYSAFFKIFAVEDVDANSARVTVIPPFTSAGWAAMSSGEQLPFQPEFGAVQILANNTSDWESFCPNAPTNTNRELLVDWFGTTRETRCRNKEYEEGLKQILGGNVNQYLAKFRYLDVADRNKQEMAYWEQTWLNAIWFSQRISEHQTSDPTWDDIEALDVVTDPEDPSCEYERKANPIGIHTQLVENGRRLDLQGGVLDFDMLAELLQTMRRNRQLDGRDHEVIDLMMDRFTKSKLDSLLIRYLQQEYNVQWQKNVSEGKVKDENGVVMFEYTVYDLPRQQLKVGLFTHRFFEDRVSAFGNGTGGLNGSVNNKNRGRMITAIDFEDILVGILETNSVTREYKNEITAQANSLYTCRMKLNTKTFDLRSKTWDVEIGDFERHLVIENFSDACPTITVSGCEPATS